MAPKITLSMFLYFATLFPARCRYYTLVPVQPCSSLHRSAAPVYKSGPTMVPGCAYALIRSQSSVAPGPSHRSHVMYRRRYRTTLGLGLGSSFSSSFSTTLSFRTSTHTSSTPVPTATDTVRSDAKATAAKLKSKYENAGTAQGLCVCLNLVP